MEGLGADVQDRSLGHVFFFFLLSGFDVGANALADKTFLGIDGIPANVADNSF